MTEPQPPAEPTPVTPPEAETPAAPPPEAPAASAAEVPAPPEADEVTEPVALDADAVAALMPADAAAAAPLDESAAPPPAPAADAAPTQPTMPPASPPPAAPPPVAPAAAVPVVTTPPAPVVAAPVAAVPVAVAAPPKKRSATSTISKIVAFLFGILQALLVLRIVLLLLVANQDNAIVSWVLSVTDPFVEPFRGVFNLDEIEGQRGAVLDVAAVVAIIAWSLIETLILSVLRLIGRRD